MIKKTWSSISRRLFSQKKTLGRSARRDARKYKRISVAEIKALPLKVEFSNPLALSQVSRIVNISLEGFAVPSADVDGVKISCEEPARIYFINQWVPVVTKKVYQGIYVAGYEIVSVGVDFTSLFCEFLGLIEYGSTLRQINKKYLKEKYKERGWRCLRGSGPTDLLLKIDAESKLEEFLLTFRVGEEYRELRFNSDVFSSGITVDHSGIGARMRTHQQIDSSILRAAFFILIGLPRSDISAALEPLLERIFEQISAV